MVTRPQSSVAVATPVALVLVLAGHCSTRSGGGEIIGGTVSLTITRVLHELEQPLLVTFRNRVKLAPQAAPALTLTVCAFVAPEMEPLPVIDHEYAEKPGGAANCAVDVGHIDPGPPIE